MEMKSSKELLMVTPSRKQLLADCVEKTTANFYKQMEIIAKSGFTSHTDELLSYFTLNVKREEYPEVIPAIIKNFQDMGYVVTEPYKEKQKQFQGSDTVISVSWGE